MNYRITLVSIKRFLILGVLNFLILILFLFIGVFLHIILSPLILMVIMVFILSGGYQLSKILSRRIVNIKLTDSSLEFDKKCVLFSELEGYYINREGLSMTTIEFRDIRHNAYSLTSLKKGKEAKEFDLLLSDLVQKFNNINLMELSYYEFHNKQYGFIRATIYIAFAIVVLLDLLYFYLILVKGVPFNWKLLLVNFLLIWLYSFHKQNEKKFKKQ